MTEAHEQFRTVASLQGPILSGAGFPGRCPSLSPFGPLVLIGENQRGFIA